MSAANNGGPAFPASVDEHYYSMGDKARRVSHSGMTLRDYFAAKAMAATIVAQGHELNYSGISLAAYEHADAMLAERAK